MHTIYAPVLNAPAHHSPDCATSHASPSQQAGATNAARTSPHLRSCAMRACMRPNHRSYMCHASIPCPHTCATLRASRSSRHLRLRQTSPFTTTPVAHVYVLHIIADHCFTCVMRPTHDCTLTMHASHSPLAPSSHASITTAP